MGGEPMGDFVFGAKVRYMFAREIGFIVGEDGMRKPEATGRTIGIVCSSSHALWRHQTIWANNTLG